MQGQLTASEVQLNVHFLEGCSVVAWAGELAREGTFIVNVGSEGGLLEVEVQNPEAPQRFWANNARLQSVLLEFRRVGDVRWKVARNEDNQMADFKELESSFGFARLLWNTAALPDGAYELRASALCHPASLNPPDGINDNFSTLLRGLVDRVPPRLFTAVPEPADGLLSPGDEIGLEFTEEILCSRPFSFAVAVRVGSKLQLGLSDLDVICEGRRLRVSLARRLSPASLAGQEVQVNVSLIQDLALNKLAAPIRWHFQVAEDASAVEVAVEISGLQLAQAWEPALADHDSAGYHAFAAALLAELAAALGVSPSRVEVATLYASDTNETVVDLRVLPREEGAGEAAANDGLSADELVEELSDLLTLKAQNESSPLDDLALLGSVDGNSVADLQVALGSSNLATNVVAANTGGSQVDSETQSQADSMVEVDLTVVVILLVVLLVQVLVVLWLVYATRAKIGVLAAAFATSTNKSSKDWAINRPPQHFGFQIHNLDEHDSVSQLNEADYVIVQETPTA